MLFALEIHTIPYLFIVVDDKIWVILNEHTSVSCFKPFINSTHLEFRLKLSEPSSKDQNLVWNILTLLFKLLSFLGIDL